MFYTDIAGRIHLLTLICFSFFIFALTLCFRKNRVLSSLSGTAFFIPLTLGIASCFAGEKSLSFSLLFLSEAALIPAVCLVIISKPKSYSLTEFVIFCTPLLLLFAVLYVEDLNTWLDTPLTKGVILLVGLLLALTIRIKSKNTKVTFSNAIFILLAGLFAESVIHFPYSSSVLAAAALTSYMMFSVYFYKECYGVLIRKVEETEKKFSVLNRSLDLEVKKRTLEIEKVNRKLVDISRTDSLSKALNKAAVTDAIEKLILSKTREFSILMFDIDDFKTINDTMGHIEGDKCIRKLALIARSSLREIDMLGRYGGDEFLIVLPSINSTQSRLIAERLRKKVDETVFPHFTISIGIASFPQDGATAKDLIGFADEGLYLSKEKGKNAISHKNLF